jgi:hypothetical protein
MPDDPSIRPRPMTGTTSPATPHSAIVTLADGDFHFGVAALANALARHGFRGTLWVGTRGALPPWAGGATAEGDVRRLAVADGLAIRFFPLAAEGLLSFHKARALLHVLDDLAPDVDRLFFFDADIVVKNAWAVFEDWAADATAVCLDISDPYMLPGHPKRRFWARMLERRGLPVRPVTGYYNAGFLGLNRRDRALLETWARLVDWLPEEGRPHHVRRFATRASPLHFMDQDMFNAALMAVDVPLAPIGPDAMDALFPYNAFMAHAFWRQKPWKRDYVRDALRGFPPDKAHVEYWKYLDGPIRPFTAAEHRRRMRGLTLGKLIGRFYARPSVED